MWSKWNQYREDFTVSGGWYWNNPISVASAMIQPSTPARCAEQCSSLALLQAVPSQSAAAASPTSSSPVPPSASLAAPSNSGEREALAERYYPGAFCDKAQGSGDGCRLWHLIVVALTCSSRLTTHSKRAVVTVLFSDFGLKFRSATQFSQLLQFS